jgi:hypothetical protein
MSKYLELSLPQLPIEGEPATFKRDLFTSLGGWASVLQAILDRGIVLEDNVDCRVVSFTSSATPDAENTVAHDLGKIPLYFVVGDIDKAAIVYKGTTAFTKTNVYVKVNVASTAVKLILF